MIYVDKDRTGGYVKDSKVYDWNCDGRLSSRDDLNKLYVALVSLRGLVSGFELVLSEPPRVGEPVTPAGGNHLWVARGAQVCIPACLKQSLSPSMLYVL